MKYIKFITISFFIIILIGCGQTGRLYLPNKENAITSQIDNKPPAEPIVEETNGQIA